ncbi:MAG: adenylate kinase [Bacteroidia bacterium]|nr:adenylate kinase [Bacteroidia bacterium]
MLNIILFGSPGSGKGTQSMNIIYKFGLTHLSTGDILRAEIAEGTPLGLAAKVFIDQGELVPDEIMIGMIRDILNGCKYCKGFIFDGFPRTVPQAINLDSLLKERNSSISALFELQVNEEELEKRLVNRGLTSQRSDDINIEIIRKRIRLYHDYTRAVINYYQSQGKFYALNGSEKIERVFEDICQVIDQNKHAF